jgi:hypothetical protein
MDLFRSRRRMSGMRRLALALVAAVAAALPSSVPAAGCSPLDCAPSASSLGDRLLAVRPNGVDGLVQVVDLANGKTRLRLPPGVLTGRTLVNLDGSVLTWFDAGTGVRVADALGPGGQLVGTSAEGKFAVLARTHKRQTTFAIVAPGSLRSVTLPGSNWGFDALSGDRLFLLQYLRNGYQVRLYDLARNRLDPQPLKDAEESALIRGSAWQRLASPDGRYLFTLYIGGSGGAMIHELDLHTVTARCIDLPDDGDFNSATAYGLALSPDGRTLWAASTGYGVVAAIDVAAAKVRKSFRFTASAPNGPVAPAVALSARGDMLALGLVGDVFIANLKTQRVRKKLHGALALGFSPDGRRLWLIGTRVTPLIVR